MNKEFCTIQSVVISGFLPAYKGVVNIPQDADKITRIMFAVENYKHTQIEVNNEPFDLPTAAGFISLIKENDSDIVIPEIYVSDKKNNFEKAVIHLNESVDNSNIKFVFRKENQSKLDYYGTYPASYDQYGNVTSMKKYYNRTKIEQEITLKIYIYYTRKIA